MGVFIFGSIYLFFLWSWFLNFLNLFEVIFTAIQITENVDLIKQITYVSFNYNKKLLK